MRRLQTWGPILMLAAGAAFLVGCGRSQTPARPRVQVGQPAPEIDGEDLNGQRFKLSDYRGKVVLLSFWGDW